MMPNFFMVAVTWKIAFPGASAGILAMRNVANPKDHPELDRLKDDLENRLRAHYSGSSRADINALPIIRAYHDYYSTFKKTYHVQLQLESIVIKGKTIPNVAALVEAMFMAEVKNLLLTAGHDLDTVQPPVLLDVSNGSERYILLNGQEQVLKPNDMMISDTQGVISSVIYGPDQRTRITPQTRRVLFTVYAPPGIGGQVVHDHLMDIQSNVLLITPEAEVESLAVYEA